MRKIVPLVFALVLLAGIVLWAGCSIGGGTGAGQTKTKTPAWAEKFKSAPTLEELGVEPYPASEIDESKTMVVVGRGQQSGDVRLSRQPVPGGQRRRLLPEFTQGHEKLPGDAGQRRWRYLYIRDR